MWEDDKLIRTIQTLPPLYIIEIDYSWKQEIWPTGSSQVIYKGKEAI